MFEFLFEVNKQNQLSFDFQYKLLESLEIAKFLYDANHPHRFITLQQVDSLNKEEQVTYIPVGSMEFVDKVILWNENYVDFKANPIYIPKELQVEGFLKRTLIFEKGKQRNLDDRYFIKSLESYKDFTDVNNYYSFNEEKEVVLSTLIDIQSEYRCFVYEDMILSVRNYSGDEFIVPNKETVQNMISLYKTSPKAYTLDVGILASGETVILEVHPFLSCGLYGADLSAYMIPMTINGYLYYKKNKK